MWPYHAMIFFGGQICVVAKLIHSDTLARFGYKLNMKVIQ
jgi:hypothetical protein